MHTDTDVRASDGRTPPPEEATPNPRAKHAGR